MTSPCENTASDQGREGINPGRTYSTPIPRNAKSEMAPREIHYLL